MDRVQVPGTVVEGVCTLGTRNTADAFNLVQLDLLIAGW
jgi:hypothetical protein